MRSATQSGTNRPSTQGAKRSHDSVTCDSALPTRLAHILSLRVYFYTCFSVRVEAGGAGQRTSCNRHPSCHSETSRSSHCFDSFPSLPLAGLRPAVSPSLSHGVSFVDGSSALACVCMGASQQGVWLQGRLRERGGESDFHI